MTSERVQRRDERESKSDASPLQAEREIEAGAPRNTPPDNPSMKSRRSATSSGFGSVACSTRGAAVRRLLG